MLNGWTGFVWHAAWGTSAKERCQQFVVTFLAGGGRAGNADGSGLAWLLQLRISFKSKLTGGEMQPSVV
ncbi:hypothetical protein RESH_04147 [Rhodopirellula europaea SH398]|jgi:hypothetical protein|uniref:Uncharacterized protein n=1 Tax=Rhodopirellula europaea SH398 TaxID=1263868 RepID=M5S1F1_9BACT|nr:hypothetical protein RESH_04147 [Rhodopirellula europaea SH398]